METKVAGAIIDPDINVDLDEFARNKLMALDIVIDNHNIMDVENMSHIDMDRAFKKAEEILCWAYTKDKNKSHDN